MRKIPTVFASLKTGATNIRYLLHNYLWHEVSDPAGVAPVRMLPVGHVDEVHLVVLATHHVGHGPRHRGSRLHRVQSRKKAPQKIFKSRGIWARPEQSALVSMRIRIQNFRSMPIRIQLRIRIQDSADPKILILREEINSVLNKIAIYLSLGLHEGCPSLQEKPSSPKREYQGSSTAKLEISCFGSFCPGSSRPKSMGIHPDSNPQQCLKIS